MNQRLQSFACISLLGACVSVAIGSPGDWSHYFWVDRANAYAVIFCDGVNPGYGAWDDDCANFTSQIAQAGCAGMAEMNNNNWGDYWVGPRDDCWLYYNDHADQNSEPWCSMDDFNYNGFPQTACHSTGQPWFSDCYIWCPTHNHLVIAAAQAQLTWFMCNYANTPD